MKSNKKTLLLVVGLPGAQKTNLCNLLRYEGFRLISMSDVIYAHMKKNNETITLDRLIDYSLRIRKTFGNMYLAQECIKKIMSYMDDRKFVVDGVRTREEVTLFKEICSHCIVLAIHSTPNGRYEYMIAHPQSLVKSLEDAIKLDRYELNLGVGEVILLADYFIFHEGRKDRSEEIKKQTEKFLNWLAKQHGEKHEIF